jgi:hypothetical protein
MAEQMIKRLRVPEVQQNFKIRMPNENARIGEDIAHAGTPSNPVVNFRYRGKPFSQKDTFIDDIQRYAFVFINNTGKQNIRPEGPVSLMNLEQVNHFLHVKQLEDENKNPDNKFNPTVNPQWVRTHIHCQGINNTDPLTEPTTIGDERMFTVLAIGNTSIVNVFGGDVKSTDRLWYFYTSRRAQRPTSLQQKH